MSHRKKEDTVSIDGQVTSNAYEMKCSADSSVEWGDMSFPPSRSAASCTALFATSNNCYI